MKFPASLLMHFGPRRRYLLGYCVLVGAAAGGMVVFWPRQRPGIVAMLFVSLAAGWVMARVSNRRLRRRMHRLRELADAIGRGELGHRISLHGHDDFAKLAESLDRMAAELENRVREQEGLQKELARAEKLAMIGELAATVAHEVNNPLDGLQNATRIIRRNPHDVEQARRLLDMMDGGLYRIEMIVRRLLSLSRAEPVSLQPVRLEEVVDDALSFVQPRLERGHVEVARDFPAEPLTVRADRMQLAQVLINLALNAADAMPHGGRLRLSSRLDASGECVCLEVGDTGTGIEPQHLPHIFEPFYTTKRCGRGTGLGLAVVARVIEAHQGRIQVRSELGKGTLFAISLPAVAGREGTVTAANASA